MTTRLLPSDEWGRLSDTYLAPVWETLRAGTDRVIVVEQEGQIVACWTLIPVVHVEGLWVHPDYRGRSAVGRRLLRAMQQEAAEMGAHAVITSAFEADIADYARRVGAVALPGMHFAMPIPSQETRCQQD